MATVEEFTHEMLRQYLDGRGWRWLVDVDGDYVVEFAYDEDFGCELTLYLIMSGKEKEILEVRVLSDMRIPKAHWGEALHACNTWNDTKRWPKVFLHVANVETDLFARITCEGHIDLEQGVHQELLDSFINTVTRSANGFWEWLHSTFGYTMAFTVEKPSQEIPD